jgi:hypothetical protein
MFYWAIEMLSEKMKGKSNAVAGEDPEDPTKTARGSTSDAPAAPAPPALPKGPAE